MAKVAKAVRIQFECCECGESSSQDFGELVVHADSWHVDSFYNGTDLEFNLVCGHCGEHQEAKVTV